jgi:hypothetical protein
MERNQNRMLGRPKQDKVLALAEKMDRLMPEEQVLEKLVELIGQGNIKAIQLWLNYRRGLPKQTIEQKTDHTLVNFKVTDLVRFNATDTE